MKKKIYLILEIAIIAWAVFVSLSDLLGRKEQIELKDIEMRMNALTQERTTSWTQSNGTPDSIYYVSFGGDTTYYLKVGNSTTADTSTIYKLYP
ncbi:MAG: hypothetical protein GY820_38545 [Gammaproteobacteria bacterium]|nr:hypothetical protein [Gammaproteobacteria bacterium]